MNLDIFDMFQSISVIILIDDEFSIGAFSTLYLDYVQFLSQTLNQPFVQGTLLSVDSV